ncbi:MAG: hypothetical protein LBQ31_02805 [Bacteroidales bacterium]|jgi:hypothetical protein|nr:hypothetical protein [Bacteroidales bacterium]
MKKVKSLLHLVLNYNSSSNYNYKAHVVACAFFLQMICAPTVEAQFYTGSNLTFGRKRVQYEKFFWSYNRFNGFDIYFNRKGKNLALYTASYVQNHLSEMEEKMGVESTSGMKFIVFNRLTDFKQSNIGYVDDATESSRNTGGITHFENNKMFLYFNGSYVDFERQIRAGIAEMLLSQAIDGNVGKQISNSYRATDMPYWFRSGLAMYFSKEWDVEDDEKIQSAIRKKSFTNMSDLEGEEARLAGYSFWHFVSEKYGTSAVSRCVSVVARAHTLKKTFNRAFNKNFSEMEKEWTEFYKEKSVQFARPPQEMPVAETISRTKKKNSTYGTLALNDSLVAYVRNHLGRATVWVENIYGKPRRRCIYRIGASINDFPDYSFPILSWHPNGHQLGIVAEEKGRTMLIMHDMEALRGEEKKMRYNLEIYEKITGFNFTPDGREIIFAGVSNGYSDIYRFHLGAGTFKRITNDMYDDFNPVMTDGEKIVFSSNRPDDTLRQNEKFLQAPSFQNEQKLFTPVSQKLLMPLVENAYSPQAATTATTATAATAATAAAAAATTPTALFYLTNENGLTNIGYGEFGRQVSHIDTAIHYRSTFKSKTITDFSPELKEISTGGNLLGTVTLSPKGYTLSLDSVAPLAAREARKNSSVRKKKTQVQKTEQKDTRPKKRLRLSNARSEDIVKQTAFDRYLLSKGLTADTARAFTATTKEATEAIEDTAHPKIPPKQYTYNTEYFINEATTQLGFDFLTAGYQAYSGSNGPIYLNPSLTALTKIGISDLMENHRIIGGFGIGFDLSNSEFMFSYENLERRLSHQIVLHLSNTSDNTDIYNATRNQSYNTHYIMKYPLTPTNMIKGAVIGRLDRTVYKGTSPITLEKKDSYILRFGLRGEWVYDHSRYIMPNIYNGLRAKAWAEYYQGVWGKKDNLFVVGFDGRYYKKIYRTFIWASRFAVSTSFGQSKLIYYMGGVDSWMLAKFNRETKVNDKMEYAYQTLATNMRGFSQNIRNGNTFAVINTELRLPIFQVLSRTLVNSAFLRNVMIVAFVDVGSAWSGMNPFSKDNTYYRKEITDGKLTIELERNTSPFVAGFGAGLRAQLAGYSLRLDCAWGAADYMVSKRPTLYFSLATDF